MFTVTKGISRGFDNSEQSLSLPKFGKTEHFDVATMGIPLYDEFVNLTDPYEIEWDKKCNDDKIAYFRIALRNTFVTSTECRNFSFSVDSVIIGSTLCLYILSFIEKYINDILKNVVPNNESSTLKIM